MEVTAPPVSIVSSYIDKIEAFIIEHRTLSKEIILARSHYEETTGKIKDSFSDYENRITAFLYWFIFDWTSKTLQNQNPFGIFFNSNRTSFSEQEKEIYKQLVSHHHSLFELLKINSKEAVLYDLFAKKKFRLTEKEGFFGMQSGQYFESRIFTIDRQSYCAPFFIKHPFQVKGPIYSVVKKIRKNKKSPIPFLMLLQYMQFKFETFPKFDIRKIYEFENYEI